MNILFIAPYRQLDGWGYAAYDYAKSLLTTDHNVAIKPIYMANVGRRDTIDDELSIAEKRQFDKIDVVIQNVIPPYISYLNVPLNIAWCMFETKHIQQSWMRQLNIVDALFTATKPEKQQLIDEGYKKPVFCTNNGIDIEKYNKEYNTERVSQTFQLKPNTFKFYFIGEYIQRKNIEDLVLAFYREFHFRENVDLVIKTNRAGLEGYILKNKVYNDIVNLRNNMRIYQNPQYYKNPIIITDRLSDDDMCALHQACDCFVMPSFGESLCRPALDALGFGKTPIVSDLTGMRDYIDDNVGWVVRSTLTPVVTNEPPMKDIYTSNELWASPDILSLQKAMREAYNMWVNKTIIQKQIAGLDVIKKFSYKTVGENINNAIVELTNDRTS